MSIARVKTWVSEVLTSADLNAEFNNIITYLNSGSVVLTQLGIGMTPVYDLDITHNQNGLSAIKLLNSNAGTGAIAGLILSNGGYNFNFDLFGAGYTPTGMLRANGAMIQSTGPGGLTLVNTDAQPIYFGTSSTEKMRLDASGNLGIGMTPTEILDITKTGNVTAKIKLLNASSGTVAASESYYYNGTAACEVGITGTSWTPSGMFLASGGYVTAAGAGGLTLNTSVAQPIYFGINGTEKARFTTTGKFVLGATATINAEVLSVTAGASAQAAFLKNVTAANETLGIWNADTSGDNFFLSFKTEAGGTDRGSIDYNRGGGAVRYNTTSDAAFKANITDAKAETKAALVKSITDINLREYEMKDNPGEVTHGLVAQELFEAYPNAVSPGDDTRPWMYDRSMLVFPLLAALQAAMARIEALEAKA